MSQIPLVAILNNIRSLYNVGSIFRTADAVGIEKLWLCGITGTPQTSNQKQNSRERIEKTALGAEKTVAWEQAVDPCHVALFYRKRGYKIVLLEAMREAKLYREYQASDPVCMVVGNEIAGVSEGLMRIADEVLAIDMAGVKGSLNVSVAFGIGAYHFRSCMV